MAEIEFRLLGPLEVWRDGRRLEVGGAKARALLAMLLLHAGEVVSADRLIDALWGERPPATGVNALQQHVAHLRRTVEPEGAAVDGDGVLVTRPPGYMIQVADGALDAWCFERLVKKGRGALAEDPAAAAELLREALGLWHGPALADFAYEPFARVEAERFEELRLAALEDRVDADLALGRHAEVVPELDALVSEHPLRERLAAQLMLALYRCGRQADAGGVFRAARTVLVEELAIEPGPSLRALHQRILEQDPALNLLPRDDPAVSAAGRRRHNLPVERTSFVGRERDLERVRALLPDARVLTFTGVGGSGKTRLALRTARSAVDHYPDGVWLAELAPLADPALVATAVAAAVGVRERSGGVIEALTRRLRDSDLLLVLDNCEHVIEACAELAGELASSCERLGILATSREPLRISGEITWPVPGLELPDSRMQLAPDELEGYGAIRLFVERAAAARPGFTLHAQNVGAVVGVCRRLDGIPLAIELAAAKVSALAPEEILQRLDDRFRLLTGGARDTLARQQTLRATIDWSHDLLSDPERALFRRLAVFARGFTAADAERVCADDGLPAEAIFELLCELVAKSLVVAEPASAVRTRYRMLETLREYAAEYLAAAGERDNVCRRHLGHFLEMAEQAHRERQTLGLNAEVQALRGEQDNIRAALAFAQVTDPPAQLRLAAACEQLWFAGHANEGRHWLTEALARAPEATTERVRALNSAAALAALQQMRDEANRLLDESLALSATLDDRDGEAGARLWLAFRDLTSDPPGTGNARRSLALHEAVGDKLGVCRSLLFLGIALGVNPESREASRRALERAVRLARGLDDGWAEGFARSFLGHADIDEGHRELAANHFRAAVQAEVLGPVRGQALDGFARLALERDPRRAIRLLGAARAMRKRYGGRAPAWRERVNEATRAKAEQRLDALASHRAWEEGLTMSTEEAIAHALEDIDAAA